MPTCTRVSQAGFQHRGLFNRREAVKEEVWCPQEDRPNLTACCPISQGSQNYNRGWISSTSKCCSSEPHSIEDWLLTLVYWFLGALLLAFCVAQFKTCCSIFCCFYLDKKWVSKECNYDSERIIYYTQCVNGLWLPIYVHFVAKRPVDLYWIGYIIFYLGFDPLPPFTQCLKNDPFWVAIASLT